METLKAAKEREDERGIRDIVVSSTEGTTALKERARVGLELFYV